MNFQLNSKDVVIDDRGSVMHCDVWSTRESKPPYVLLIHGQGGLLGKAPPANTQLTYKEQSLGKFAALYDRAKPHFTVIVAHRPAYELSPPLKSNDYPVTYKRVAGWYKRCLAELGIVSRKTRWNMAKQRTIVRDEPFIGWSYRSAPDRYC